MKKALNIISMLLLFFFGIAIAENAHWEFGGGGGARSYSTSFGTRTLIRDLNNRTGLIRGLGKHVVKSVVRDKLERDAQRRLQENRNAARELRYLRKATSHEYGRSKVIIRGDKVDWRKWPWK